ncbi:hypothetical protein Tco_0714537 [Tanacetum coccineum]
METQPNDRRHLVNYDNDNDNDDLGYESEVYLDKEEEDGNNHSDGNVVKRGITRLSKFRREYGKPNGIKLSVTFDALNRILGSQRALFSSFLGDLIREHIAAAKMARSKSVYQHTMGRGGYAHVKQKMIKNKEIEPDEEPPHGIMSLKGRVNKDEQFPNDEIRLKETEDKIKEGTLKVDHGTDAMTVVLEGMVTKLMNQLTAQGEQLQSMSTKLTPSDVDRRAAETPLSVGGCENYARIQESNGLATSKKEMETRETVNSVGSMKMTKSLRKESSRQDSQSQENVSPLLVLPQMMEKTNAS